MSEYWAICTFSPFIFHTQSTCYPMFLMIFFSLYLLLQILVLNTNTQELVASFRVTTGTSNTTAIKSIEFARKGRWVVAGGLSVCNLEWWTQSRDHNQDNLFQLIFGFQSYSLMFCILWALSFLLMPSFSLSLCTCVLFVMQLLPNKHSRPDHQGVWRQRDPDLWPGRWAWTYAETSGLGKQVHLWRYIFGIKVMPV